MKEIIYETELIRQAPTYVVLLELIEVINEVTHRQIQIIVHMLLFLPIVKNNKHYGQ